jgi:hypothetical protein
MLPQHCVTKWWSQFFQKKKKKKKRGRIGTMAGSGCTASGRRAYGGLWRLVVVVTAMAV